MRTAAVVLACTPLPIAAQPAVAQPAVVYSVGGKFDASFNEGAWHGAQRWAYETGGTYGEFEIDSVGRSQQALRTLAQRGFDPVVAVGFLHADALRTVAAEYPDTRFAIIDVVVDAPNVMSVVFREHEGAYIAGAMASMASDSGVIGMVGGMDIALIRRFECGYRQGALVQNPEIQVITSMTGTTPSAWADPVRGAQIAQAQIEQGVDVMVQAAGGTGIGVLQAASDAGILGIGTDINQNGLHPGYVLTSMLKRVDVAVLQAFEAEAWAPGIRSLGIAEFGLAIVMDEHNADLVSAQMLQMANTTARAIANGQISVHDISVQGECPYD